MGVDQDLVVACKDKKKQPLTLSLFAYCLQVRALHTLTSSMFSSRHPRIVYIKSNGFTEGLAPHLVCVTVKSVSTLCNEHVNWLLVASIWIPEPVSVALGPGTSLTHSSCFFCNWEVIDSRWEIVSATFESNLLLFK